METLASVVNIMRKDNLQEIPWKQLKECGLLKKTLSLTPKPICGKVLFHAKQQTHNFRKRMGLQVCVFKIGVTSDPAQRFMDYLQKNFTAMWVIHESDSLDLVHMLEAALISEFHDVSGCKNAANSGGEGALNRKVHSGPPFYVYLTGGRADQLKWVG